MISHNVYGQTQLHTTRGDHQIAGGMKEPMTYMQEWRICLRCVKVRLKADDEWYNNDTDELTIHSYIPIQSVPGLYRPKTLR